MNLYAGEQWWNGQLGVAVIDLDFALEMIAVGNAHADQMWFQPGGDVDTVDPDLAVRPHPMGLCFGAEERSCSFIRVSRFSGS